MQSRLEQAVLAAAEGQSPPKVWHLGPKAGVTLGDGPNPFDGAVLSAWESR
ncbi:hypothetical protein MSP7336_01475 [Mycobacterium shimoidei]|uniref:Uncharacterized protein n=1 Tax=Mycobacterium shimoidei TaxID=29313 RepID=A0A375YWK2_MYCSH|nr:hypothetical protein [Mycobacterium shimoidei]SRX93239.1 hypothetical protein MSP7336_01475 [Mycobacterium shimoidei]